MLVFVIGRNFKNNAAFFEFFLMVVHISGFKPAGKNRFPGLVKFAVR